jgi:hypothetical protein
LNQKTTTKKHPNKIQLKPTGMSIFRRKTKKEKLQKKYREKLSESHKMSTINRKLSDQLMFEAEQLLKQIENEN